MSSNYCHSSSFFFLHELFSFLPFNMKCVSIWIIFKVEKKRKTNVNLYVKTVREDRRPRWE